MNTLQVGDIVNGRTVHSLGYLLSLYSNVTLNLVSPPSLAADTQMVERLQARGLTVNQCDSYRDLLPDTDVLYMTRIQQERFATKEDYLKVKGLYVLTPDDLVPTKAKKTLAVMHPLPRVDEIHPSVDDDPRAAYFRQTHYGVSMRMALLSLVLGCV